MASRKQQPAAERTTIPAGHARAAFVARGRRVRVINTHGTQVVDCWAFNADDTAEYMSMEHCRVSFERYRPRRGDTMVTNKRRPILEIMEDTANGAHDTLLAACDRYRYQLLGCEGYHRNCTDNLWEAMIGAGYKITETPSPFNLWQNTPVEADGAIRPNPPCYRKGDFIVMRAKMDLVICLSACPQDITPINASRPRNAHFELLP